MSNDLIEIETRLAYQEDLIHELNQTVCKQDRMISQLQMQVSSLAKKMNEAVFSDGKQEASENERPPHY